MQKPNENGYADGSVWIQDGVTIDGAESGPLVGSRLAVKDLFDIEGFITGCGNPDWRASHPPASATASVVQSLMQAGARVVGKTQTDELAYSLNGANVHYGTPVNPVANGRLPGGSSSGSAVAVASGQADIGVGTDTGGSIRIPSSYCGLYGLRPTWGAISLAGAQALAPSFDTAGLMCRDPDLLRRAADVVLPAQSPRHYKRAVLLLPEGVEVPQAEVIARLAGLGLETSAIELSEARMTLASEAFRLLQGREIWQTHGAWLQDVDPELAPDIKARLDWCQTLTDSDEERGHLLQQEVVAWLGSLTCDADTLICLPSAPGAAPLLDIGATELAAYRNRLMGMTALAGLWGAPVTAVPWLEDANAPWGISLVGKPGDDRALLDLINP